MRWIPGIVKKQKSHRFRWLEVAKTDQISNLKLIQDLSKIADYMHNINIF
jgi:hypothetical protein